MRGWTFDIDLYENTDCDDSWHGEGETHWKTFQVTTGSSGLAGFVLEFSELLTDDVITATATDDMGNTSEFSHCAWIDQSVFLVVNSTGDAGDTQPGDGSCYTGGINSESEPECTLRAAIQEINALSGSQTVIFDIPGEGPHTIAPTTELPAVVGQAVLDATTQEGFLGSPVVEIDGSDGAEIDGLTLSGAAVTVRGFVINQFDGDGIVMHGSGAHVAELNYVGTDVTGSEDRGNSGHGVLVSDGNYNRVGSPDPDMANIIAFNDSSGVHIAAGLGNSIPGNSIHTNDRLGVDLVGGSETDEGVTSNDTGDEDTGPNELQNFPTLDRAAVNGDELDIEGTLDGVSEVTYHIEVFGNSECDSSAFGEGRTYLGSFELTLVGGDPTFDETLPLDGRSAGDFITATATDADGSTSEFSACIAVDVVPFAVSLGVLQNPYLSQFLDIYMVASADVDSQSVTLTAGAEDVPMTLVDPSENVWKGDYELTESGTVPIAVCATGMTGMADCDSTSVTALLATEGTPVDLQSADGRLGIACAVRGQQEIKSCPGKPHGQWLQSRRGEFDHR
jgi:CSLREA domain-containing protein